MSIYDVSTILYTIVKYGRIDLLELLVFLVKLLHFSQQNFQKKSFRATKTVSL